jgi:hypothetical protein
MISEIEFKRGRWSVDPADPVQLANALADAAWRSPAFDHRRRKRELRKARVRARMKILAEQPDLQRHRK